MREKQKNTKIYVYSSLITFKLLLSTMKKIENYFCY